MIVHAVPQPNTRQKACYGTRLTFQLAKDAKMDECHRSLLLHSAWRADPEPYPRRCLYQGPHQLLEKLSPKQFAQS